HRQRAWVCLRHFAPASLPSTSPGEPAHHLAVRRDQLGPAQLRRLGEQSLCRRCGWGSDARFHWPRTKMGKRGLRPLAAYVKDIATVGASLGAVVMRDDAARTHRPDIARAGSMYLGQDLGIGNPRRMWLQGTDQRACLGSDMQEGTAGRTNE